MSVLVRPNHPARLAGVFLAAVAICAVIAAAAGALIYLVGDLRSGPATPPTPPSVAAPAGVLIVRPVADAAAFEDLAGFAPIVPASIPAGADPEASYAVSPADATGARAGRVTFLARDSADGAAVVLVQSKIADRAAFEEAPLRRITDTTPTYVAALACGDLVVNAEIYFTGTLSDERMDADAARFIAAMRRQCEG